MQPSPEELPLAYAEPGVRTAPRRTLPRVLGRWIWNVIRAIVALVRAALLGLGYLALGLAILTSGVLLAIARTLLFIGRVRWNGRAVLVWTVRTFNRAAIRVAGLFYLRFKRIPLATTHAPAKCPPSLPTNAHPIHAETQGSS